MSTGFPIPEIAPEPSVSDTNQDVNGAQKRKLPNKNSRQRFKPQLSCTLCRSRKLKCDRNQPCQNCTKRDLSSSCTFIHAGLRNKSVGGIHKQLTGKSDDINGRIRNLEELVVSLMHKTAESTENTQTPIISQVTPPVPEIALQSTFEDAQRKNSESLGRMGIDDNHLNYVGAAHWAAILDSIAGVKELLEDSDGVQISENFNIPAPSGPELLVGGIGRVPKSEILASIPPKSIVQLLVDHFHSSPEFASIIHAPTFKKEYEEFWVDPEAASVMWIGLLFSIMTITLSVEVVTSHSPSSIADHTVRDPHKLIKVFREKTVQCLIFADYTQPTPYTIETLLLYFLVDCFSNTASPSGSWTLMGVITRVAMRLGLHRDASHFANISVFQGEMQRRHWALIEHLDLQTSCQVGLPRNIREEIFDTKPPRNLLDQDFDINCTELPPSRPYSEFIPITYPLLKNAISRAYGAIVDKTSSVHLIPYDIIMALDSQLNNAYYQVPESFRVYSSDDLRIGSPTSRIQKFSIDLSYQRARCVLHRRYLVLGKSVVANPYSYSVKVCIEAAVQILQTQAAIYDYAKPGKDLNSQRWRLSSLMTHDFFQAAMLICLYLSHTFVETSSDFEQMSSSSPVKQTKEELLQTLEKSQSISEEAGSSSKDAAKVARALKLLVSNLKRSPTPYSASGAQFPLGLVSPPHTNSTSPNTIGLNNVIDLEKITSTAIRNSFGLDGPSVPQLFKSPSAEGAQLSHTSLDYDDIDWELWDTQFQPDFLNESSDFWQLDTT